MSDENMIAEGRYLAKVSEAVLAWTAKREPQIAVGFEILEPQSVAGRQITWYGSLAHTTISAGKNEGRQVAELTLEALEVCGWDGDGLSEKSLGSCAGGEVSIVVRHEEYDGKTMARVKFINPPSSIGAAVKERLNAAEASNVEKQFAGLLAKRKQQRGAKAAATGQRRPPQQSRRQPPPNAGDAWEDGPGPDAYDDL